jgi:hypothetical protein
MSNLMRGNVPRRISSICPNQGTGIARSFITLAGSSTRFQYKAVALNQIRHGTSINVILLEDVSNRGEIYFLDYTFLMNLSYL